MRQCILDEFYDELVTAWAKLTQEDSSPMNLTTLTHVTAGAIYLARMFTRFGEGHPRRLERAVNASVALTKSVNEALTRKGKGE